MTGPEPTRFERLRAVERVRAHALLGGALVAGWVLHDLVVFLVSGEPALAAGLLLHSLALVLVGALGAVLLLERRWLLGLTLAGLALVWLAPGLVPIHWIQARTQLVRALLALGLAAAGASWLVRRTPLRAARVGLSVGALACSCVALFTTQWTGFATFVSAGAALFLAAGLVEASRVRVALTLAAAVLALLPPVLRAVEDGGLGRADLPVAAPVPGNERLNLLLVVLDTVRADRLAPYGYKRVTTPELDALVRERARVYAGARSTSSWTLPSHGSLFTGLMPSEHGATHPRGARIASTMTGSALPVQKLRSDVPTLAGLLRELGYRTGAVIANTAYLLPRFGLDRGYEHYDARPGGLVHGYFPLAQLAWLPVREGRQVYRDAPTITDLALRWLERDPGGRPYFLTVNYMDAHAPYLPPAPYDEAFGGGCVPEPWRLQRHNRSLLYDRSLLFMDAHLARLLAAVDFERTVVVVTSDHGEALGDHGFWMHGWTLFDDVVRVPLYVMSPGGTAGVVDEVVSGADVFHLALRELGAELDPATAAGRPFGEWYQKGWTPRTPLFADKHVERDLLAWMDGSRKMIVASTGEVAVYDLAADPRELSPLELSAEELAAARRRAETWWREHPHVDTGGVGELGTRELERLRELGYVGGDY